MEPSKHKLAALWSTPSRRLTLALVALGILVYVPFAGNYGLWDPWETHYGEVARQMLERNDFISQWWPGSPQDRAEFWSKPVLTFWLMAISMKLFGLEWHPNAPADEMVTSWRVEWALRMPFVILGIIGVWATYELVRRVLGKRPAIIAGIVLLTSSQWALIARQAMTDMAFVVPMTVALALAGLGLLLPEDEVEATLPRRTIFKLDVPDAPAFWGFLALVLSTVIPQLVMISIQLKLALHIKAFTLRGPGIVAMLPYWAILVGALYWCTRATNKRQLYLFSSWILCALASLGKGPAGLAIPAIIMVVYLVVAGRWKEIWTRLELPRGTMLFIASCFPWYHAMLIRDGMGFWQEFIGDNYVHRAGGRHGDRGTFEYYLQYIGYGMFPWSGFVAVGSLSAFRSLVGDSKKARLACFAIVWALVDWVLVTLVNTKFHHYILPALPALAILAALCIDELLDGADSTLWAGIVLVGAPLTFLCGRDLAAFPPRILWMFNYDYVNMPGTGRPWPTVAQYGERYEYGTQLLVLAVAATLITIGLAWFARRKSTAADASDAPMISLSTFALFFVLLVVAIVAGPRTLKGAAPTVSPWLWLVPSACMLPFVVIVLRSVLAGVAGGARVMLIALSMFAAVWTGFLIDKVFVELSPHWAQKHVIAAYYANRKSADEPLIAWMLYWRGENFYTKNIIYSNPNANERTVFLGDRNVEKMQKYFASHKGKRMFFIVERVRFESLRGTLPAEARSSLQIVDESNNKLYLCSAQL